MGATALSVQEWVDTLDRAKEMALAQQSNGSYSDEAFRDLSSGLSSHANTLDRNSELQSESARLGGQPWSNLSLTTRIRSKGGKDLADAILRTAWRQSSEQLFRTLMVTLSIYLRRVYVPLTGFPL